MELSDLIGLRELSGVDMSSDSVKGEWGDGFENCEIIRFVLDGDIYMAIEDPSDGYRSRMREIKKSAEPVKNSFAPVKVMCRMKADDDRDDNDILQCVDVRNGNIVLEVGTANTDDYYPCFVARWLPEKLSADK